jgi:glycosyltransferase involved in cell wall biosynthesis
VSRDSPVRVLFLMRDALPPFRSDVNALFGHALLAEGVASDLLGQRATESESGLSWPAGRIASVGVVRESMWAELFRPLKDAWGLVCWRTPFDIVQVRDKVRTAVLGYWFARWKGKPFVYWMSFPVVEGFRFTAESRVKPSLIRRIADCLRVRLSHRVFYGFVLHKADHVFVQSEAMREWLAGKGYDPRRMTAVPMGVDVNRLSRGRIAPAENALLDGRRVVVYLGILGKARDPLFLLDLAVALREHEPNVLLLLAGDAPSQAERTWIREEIGARSLQSHVLLTGWLDQEQAVAYALRAEVGLSPVPRGELYDISSPTKLVEYLALGIPGVANDIPDQKLVIDQSGAGLCVPMEIPAFRDAVLRLLRDDQFRKECSERGPAYVRAERAYDIIAGRVATVYRDVIAEAA